MKTILIVDDEDALVAILSDILTDEGYRVVTATNGRDGLARVEAERPDLVITDFMMPIANGHELLSGLRALPGLKRLPVVLTSATDRKVAFPGRLKGDKGLSFLAKPFELSAVLSLIESLVGKGETGSH
jgi:CheY-like chemotaxis protein